QHHNMVAARGKEFGGANPHHPVGPQDRNLFAAGIRPFGGAQNASPRQDTCALLIISPVSKSAPSSAVRKARLALIGIVCQHFFPRRPPRGWAEARNRVSS